MPVIARRTLGLMFAVALLPAMAGSAAAEYPEKPIHIIVPFQPPGAADFLGRTIGDQLSAEFKQSVIVENRGGAGGAIGSAQAARAQPDGYTLVVSGTASHVVVPVAQPNVGYHPTQDFTHIAFIGGAPVGWVVSANSDIRSVKDALDRAKAGKLAGYASPGLGTTAHLAAEFVAQQTGVPLVHVPYNSAAMTDIISGRVPLGSFSWGSLVSHVKAGTVRALAVSSEQRLPEFPDVPTFKELGYDLVATGWFALSGPKGMPKEIVDKLNRTANAVMSKPEVQQKLATQSMLTRAMSPEELTRFFEQEAAKWQPIARAAGLAPQ